MLGVFWAIKKFAYELRGRHFTLETEHKALLEIRRRPSFANTRVQRWIERIQEFDFQVKYIPGKEMGIADHLIR